RGSYLRLLDLTDGKPRVRAVLESKEISFSSLAFSPPDGKTLAACSPFDVRLWDPTPTEPRQRGVVKAPERPWTLAYTPDGRRLAAANHYGQLALSDAETGTKLAGWQFPFAIYALAYASDGRHLAVANKSGTIFILRIKP